MHVLHPRSPCQGFGGSILLISYQPLSLPIRLRRVDYVHRAPANEASSGQGPASQPGPEARAPERANWPQPGPAGSSRRQPAAAGSQPGSQEGRRSRP
jgi:hypothetical protein